VNRTSRRIRGLFFMKRLGNITVCPSSLPISPFSLRPPFRSRIEPVKPAKPANLSYIIMPYEISCELSRLCPYDTVAYPTNLCKLNLSRLSPNSLKRRLPCNVQGTFMRISKITYLVEITAVNISEEYLFS
jgi:hypothetical protein